MLTRALVRTVALIALSVFVGGERLLAQDIEAERPNRPAAVRAMVTRKEPAVVKLPTELGCVRKMDNAYAAVLTYLNGTAQPSPNELSKAAQYASGIEPQDLSVVT